MVQQLAIATGFEALQIRAAAFPLTGLGARSLLRRLAVKVCRVVIGSLLRVVYYDNEARVVDPSIVVVLRKNPSPS